MVSKFAFTSNLYRYSEVHTRELNDSYYRPCTFVAYRIITEMPALLVSGASFVVILYWSVGLNDNLDRFAFFVLATEVNFTISMLIGFTIASSVTGEVGPAVLLPLFASK
jgi:ABC-type multidrug transport system permease subunit